MRRYLAVRPPTAADPATRLLCFPHAGAGALSFAGWQRRTGPAVRALPVRLPGRETRLREPRVTDADQLVDELQEELGDVLEEPHAFYGHSMGALVAYRLAQRRVAAGLRPPHVLLVGACPAPQSPTPLARRDLDELSDERLLAAFADEESFPEPLRRRPDRLAAVLRTLRDDLRLVRSLRAGPVTPLPCPVAAFAGHDDRVVSETHVRDWERCTSERFDLRRVPGTHFFVRGRDIPRLVAAEVRDRVTSSAR